MPVTTIRFSAQRPTGERSTKGKMKRVAARRMSSGT
jgi:hypothetical protein